MKKKDAKIIHLVSSNNRHSRQQFLISIDLKNYIDKLVKYLKLN